MLLIKSKEINAKSHSLQISAGIGVTQTLWRDKHHYNLPSIVDKNLFFDASGIICKF